MTIGADQSSKDYKNGRSLGMADGTVASFDATNAMFGGGGNFNVTLPWLNEHRTNYDESKSSDWKAGYEEGFKETAPKLDIYLKKVKPTGPPEPFHAPPHPPTDIKALLAGKPPSASAWQWGLGLAAVAGAAYAGSRWYRSRNTP
jgi:hypothetical protein